MDGTERGRERINPQAKENHTKYTKLCGSISAQHGHMYMQAFGCER